MIILKQLLKNNFHRKRSISMSSTTTVCSEEFTYTNPKKSCLDLEDSFNDSYNKEIFLD